MAKQLFHLAEIDEQISEESLAFAEIQTIFETARNLDDIIGAWMNRERSREMRICCGISDDPESEGQPAVFVVLEQADQEIAVGWCAKKYLAALHPNVMLIEKDIFYFEGEDSEGAEAWLDRRNERFGIKFDENYCEYQIPRKNVESLIYSYLLSDFPAEAEIFFASEESLEDVEALL